jgi:hypothetical protein
MKSLSFIGTAIIAAAFSVIFLVNYNQSNLDDLFETNLEALARQEVDEKFYYVARYDIASMFRVTRVSGQASVQVGALLTRAELEALVAGTVEGNYVDCHMRYCCRTTEMQNIECIPGTDWVACHPQCDHSQNQM